MSQLRNGCCPLLLLILCIPLLLLPIFPSLFRSFFSFSTSDFIFFACFIGYFTKRKSQGQLYRSSMFSLDISYLFETMQRRFWYTFSMWLNCLWKYCTWKYNECKKKNLQKTNSRQENIYTSTVTRTQTYTQTENQ